MIASTNTDTTNQSNNTSSRVTSLKIYIPSETLETKSWDNLPPLNNARTPLPFPPPLSRGMFASAEFSSDEFLANRRHLTLEELKKELTAHLKSLKSELVELINRDYASFIDLSTNLKGVDKAIDEISKPLGKMREEVQNVRNTLQGVVDSLENQLAHRASIREKKASLQLLINIHESVRKVEKLLLISSEENSSSITSKVDSDSNAKQIERVAIEYNQMQYLVSKGKGLPFVENIDWRIVRIKDTLRTNLSSELRSALQIAKNQSQDGTSKETLTQILRTYALIDHTKAAEQVIKEELVAPFIKETVVRQALENPSSQIQSKYLLSSKNSSSSLPHSPIRKSSKSYSFPAYSKEPLTLMYNKILNFIINDCSILLEITKKVLSGTSFEILIDSIWTEVVESITKRLSIIFNPGNPNIFHKYVFFQKIIAIFTFKEISMQIEEVLAPGLEIPSDGINESQYSPSLKLPASKSIMLTIERCWSDNIFIYGLSHRFWKLTLQTTTSPALHPVNSSNYSKGSGGVSVSNSTNVNLFDEQILRKLTVVAHDIENITIMIRENFRDNIIIKLPESMVDQPIIEESINSSLNSMEPDLSNISQKVSLILIKRCTENLKQRVLSITTFYRQPNAKPPTEPSYFVPHITKPLTIFCNANKSILSEKRKKEWNAIICDGVAVRYYNIVFEHLTILKKTEESSKIMKRVKKGKTTRSFASSLMGIANENAMSSDDSLTMSDEDKIRLQILLDVKQFGKELSNFGINPEEIKGYIELYKVVENFGMSIN
nr:9220_t:CDS:10 [Entrophospora candida]